jgi:3-oxoacyl-[acyl-carrier-protein] synthase-1/3-oxoacyl-[acyl-carrier-protein] synthase II
MSASVVAFGAVSALGVGRAAFEPGVVGEPAPSALSFDAELSEAGLRTAVVARASLVTGPDEDRAAALLELALDELLKQLEQRLPGYRALRIGLVLGTSGGGMPSFERLITRLDADLPLDAGLAGRAPYFGPLRGVTARLGVPVDRVVQVLAACASSTFAIGHALAWLDAGVADLVIAGGYDALSLFIAQGFECLGATSASPSPFRATRTGLALGEGAALLALARDAEPSLGRVLGFGASSDAGHVTAPDRAGAGLGRAARLALDASGLDVAAIGLVSAHGTGTSYNDAAEAQAIAGALGRAAPSAVVHAYKASIGHTLGAAGALESLSALACLERGVLPATAGGGAIEPALGSRLLDRAEPGAPGACLKLSSAFGGANAALVLAPAHAQGDAAEPSAARAVSVLRVGDAVTEPDTRSLHGRVRTDPIKLTRMDPLSALVVTAAAKLRGELDLPTDTAVVVGSAGATLEIDAEFERRRRRRGPEPRRFPPTSPNLCAGECTIALGLTGPSFSVGAGPAAALEALLVAHDWLAAGRVERVLVVAAEQGGDVVARLFGALGWPVPARGAVAALLGVGGSGPRLARPALAELIADAQAQGGALGDAAPGWPAFRRALAGFSA